MTNEELKRRTEGILEVTERFKRFREAFRKGQSFYEPFPETLQNSQPEMEMEEERIVRLLDTLYTQFEKENRQIETLGNQLNELGNQLKRRNEQIFELTQAFRGWYSVFCQQKIIDFN